MYNLSPKPGIFNMSDEWSYTHSTSVWLDCLVGKVSGIYIQRVGLAEVSLLRKI